MSRLAARRLERKGRRGEGRKGREEDPITYSEGRNCYNITYLLCCLVGKEGYNIVLCKTR